MESRQRSDQLLSVCEIAQSPECEKDRLVPCCPSAEAPKGGAPLGWGRDVIGRRYEENHLEEWIARCPSCIFCDQAVEILASQNHAHMVQKIDLLFLGPRTHFSVVEAKIREVRRNGGVVPYEIYRQMQGYVSFLKDYLDGYPNTHQAYYERFSRAFYGAGRPTPVLPERQQEGEPSFIEVYVAAGFDEYAVDALAGWARELSRSIRLIYFRFSSEEKKIAFYEIPTVD